MREMIRLIVVLVLICGISAGALTLARHNLSPLIEKQSDFYVRGPALERLFDRPAIELLGNKVNITADDRSYPVFYLMSEDKVASLAIEASGAGGYGGDVVIMIGIDLEADQIIGLEIIRHSETPGVGSKVETSYFRKQWRSLSASNTVALSSQGGRIDAISGATYSSKAVVNGSNQIIDFLAKHRETILETIRSSGI